MVEALFRAEVLTRKSPSPGTVWTPPMTLWEDRAIVVMLFELAGVARHAVQVFAATSDIVVSGFRASPFDCLNERTIDGHVRLKERPFGTFRRAVPVPRGFDPAQATARLEDGVLEVRIERSLGQGRTPSPRPLLDGGSIPIQ